MERVIRPDWPAPPAVCAASALRGVTPDEAWRSLGVPGQPRWLSQVHGAQVVSADQDWFSARADGCVAFAPGRACALRTADCLPILLCGEDGTRIGAAHAGWRGLAGGVIEAVVAALCEGGVSAARPQDLLAWIGPGISGAVYQVGPDVHAAIMTGAPGAVEFFSPRDGDRWLLDLSGLARRQLRRLGVARVYGGEWCTFSDPERFYSYRRDGGCSRHATFIWLDAGG